MSPDKKIYIVFGIILIVTTAIFKYNAPLYSKEIAKDPELVEGRVVNILGSRAGAVSMECEFCYDSTKYSFYSSVYSEIAEKFRNTGYDKIWIAIKKGDPKFHMVLNGNDDFKKFNIPIRDTSNFSSDSICF